MAKRRRNLTRNQIEYRKERKRLMSFQRRAEARGYIFSQPLVPEEIPSRITRKMIDELKYMKPHRIYASPNVEYVDQSSGVIVPAKVGREIEQITSRVGRMKLSTFTEKRNKLLNQYGVDLTDWTEIPQEQIDIMDNQYKQQYQSKPSFEMFPQEVRNELGMGDFEALTPEEEMLFEKDIDTKLKEIHPDIDFSNVPDEVTISPDSEVFVDKRDFLKPDVDIEGLNYLNAFLQDMREYPREFFDKLMQYIQPIIDKEGKETVGRALVDAEDNLMELMYQYDYDSSQAFSAFATSIIQSIPFLTNEQRTELERIADENQTVE